MIVHLCAQRDGRRADHSASVCVYCDRLKDEQVETEKKWQKKLAIMQRRYVSPNL